MTAGRVPRPKTAPRRKAGWRQALGGRAFAEGHAAEWLAAAWLLAKGYQLLGFRLKTPHAEIDILARRGDVLAVVEVKRRATIEAALTAISPKQLANLRLAGQAVLRQRPALNALRLRIDTVALASGRFPRHRRGL